MNRETFIGQPFIDTEGDWVYPWGIRNDHGVRVVGHAYSMASAAIAADEQLIYEVVYAALSEYLPDAECRRRAEAATHPE